MVPRPALAFLVDNEDACYSILACTIHGARRGNGMLSICDSELQVAKPQVQKYRARADNGSRKKPGNDTIRPKATNEGMRQTMLN